MASNRYAPEGTYGPYRDDDESGTYGAVHDSFGAQHDYGTYGGQFDNGQYATGHFDTGQFAAVQTGQFDTGQFDAVQTGQFDTGQFDAARTGQYDFAQTGQFDTGQFDTYASPLTETYEHPAVPVETRTPEGGSAGDTAPRFDASAVPASLFAARDDEEPPREEWNPTAESVRPVRGRHKVAKQRGGSMARSGAVLGVGMIAAVGAGGIATAQERPPAISMQDVSAATDSAASLFGGGSEETVAGSPLTQAAITEDDAKAGRTDAGEALRSRILAQAQQAQAQADASAREAAAKKATAAAEAKAAKAEAEKERKAEKARLAKLAKSFALPVSGSQLTSSFGESGSLWSNDHTGQDFAASTGTPIKAVGSGTVKEAGWAGSYGYRTILELNDGTEVWFAHQSSVNVSAGEKVAAGDTIGRVGATGNVTGAHLHMEVRPGGGSPIDPLSWLRGKGLSI